MNTPSVSKIETSEARMELGWVQVGLRLKLRSRWQVSVPHSTPFRKRLGFRLGRKETPSYFKNSFSEQLKEHLK